MPKLKARHRISQRKNKKQKRTNKKSNQITIRISRRSYKTKKHPGNTHQIQQVIRQNKKTILFIWTEWVRETHQNERRNSGEFLGGFWEIDWRISRAAEWWRTWDFWELKEPTSETEWESEGVRDTDRRREIESPQRAAERRPKSLGEDNFGFWELPDLGWEWNLGSERGSERVRTWVERRNERNTNHKQGGTEMAVNFREIASYTESGNTNFSWQISHEIPIFHDI